MSDLTQLFTAQTADGSSDAFYHLGGLMNVYIDASGEPFGTVIVNAVFPNDAERPIAGGEEITTRGVHVIEAAPFVGKIELASSNAETVDVWIESQGSAYPRVLELARGAS